MRRLLGIIICILYAVSFVAAEATLNTANMAISVNVVTEKNEGVFGVTHLKENAQKYKSDSDSSAADYNTISLTRQEDSSYSGYIWFYFYVWGNGTMKITVTATQEMRRVDKDEKDVYPIDRIDYQISFSDYEDWSMAEFSSESDSTVKTTDSVYGTSPLVASIQDVNHIREKGICKLTVTTTNKSFEKKIIGSKYTGKITISIIATT